MKGNTFWVGKVDFSNATPKYNATSLTMGSGSSFSVNTIVSISATSANDFFFAGKT